MNSEFCIIGADDVGRRFFGFIFAVCTLILQPNHGAVLI